MKQQRTRSGRVAEPFRANGKQARRTKPKCGERWLASYQETR